MTTAPIALSPRYRAEAVGALSENRFDVLVVGGGVVGAGAALDAASRGLSVALVEARDWAAGTSSRSSKLIHGGLRYLEQRDFRLVREALGERALLLTRLAPHLVRPVPFLLPLHHRVWERAYIGAGVLLYDTLGGAKALPRHRHLGRRRALQEAPGLRADALTGAIQYYDAQVDDARHTMMVARTAAQYGATVATGVRVREFLRDGDRIAGAVVVDRETGSALTVRARQVVSATGVWTDETHAMAGGRRAFDVHASKGVHLLVPRDRIRLGTGLILRTEKSVLFVIPWGGHWIIGTTDTPWELAKEDPAASGADIDYILDHVNAVLRSPLTRDDIEGVYTGLRPLLAGRSDDTSKLSREHTVARPSPGLVMVAGGKYTTYRVMAKDAVDAAAAELGSAVPESMTEQLPIVGAVGFEEMRRARRQLAGRSGLDVTRIDHLLGRYGSCIHDLLELIGADHRLAEPVPGAPQYLKAEAVYAVSHEGALHLDDVLTRRTRISIEERDRGAAAAPEVARLLAPLLGWDEETVGREVAHYQAWVLAGRKAQLQPDDASAQAAQSIPDCSTPATM